MISLLDGDLIAFRCASTAENEGEQIALARTNEFVEKLLLETEVGSYEVYISGEGNFRKTIFPEYKANRIGKYRPRHEEACKQFLISEWGAQRSHGCETDDMLGIRATELGYISIICSIDKDLSMIPGWHYHWQQTRLGEIVAEAKRFYVTPTEGLRNFYRQLIIGDAADGIKGVKGAGKKAAAVLDSYTEEIDMFNIVRGMYDNDEEMLMNGQVLHIWRKTNDIWEFPKET
jgi:5'-3' exonuclease